MWQLYTRSTAVSVMVASLIWIAGCSATQQANQVDSAPTRRQPTPPLVAPTDAENAKFDADVAAIAAALDRYKQDNGTYPTQSAGLLALVAGASHGPAVGTPYLQSIPKTPWGGDYIYELRSIAIVSTGSSQPVIGQGWLRGDDGQTWYREDQAYVIQAVAPAGVINSMPKSQFGPLPEGVFFGPMK